MIRLNVDRDELHRARVDEYVKGLRRPYAKHDDLFISEYASKTLPNPKAFLPSYNLNRILALLPYHDVIYVAICPVCLKEEDFSNFKVLVERKSILPTLTSSYGAYSDNLSDFIYAHDHISRYEYSAHKYLSLMDNSPGAICHHCVGKWETNTKEEMSKQPNLSSKSGAVPRMIGNLFPFISPDYNLLDEFEAAVKSQDLKQLSQISKLSEAVHAIRTAQAFNAPLSLNESNFTNIPNGITSEMDEAINITHNLAMDVANGLGLKIPTDIPLDQFIDISENFRPKIQSAVSQIISSQDLSRASGISRMQSEVMKINGEIDRIKGTRRYMLLEASMDFYAKNSAVVNATLLASAFGVAGGLAGCVGGPIASGGVGAVASGIATLANKKKWVKGGPAGKRLSDKIEADVQPFLSKLVSAYVGASTPAVNIMSLRTKLRGSSL